MKKYLFIIGLLLVVTILSGFMGFKGKGITLWEQGKQFYDQGEYQKAQESFEKALTEQKNNPELHFNLGNCYYQLQDYQTAINHYQKSSETKYKYYHLGNAYKLLGDQSQIQEKINFYQKAIENYKKGIIIAPDDTKLKFNYEYVKKLLEELQQESDNQENQDEQDEQDNQDNQDNQDEQDNQEQNQDESQNENQDSESEQSQENQDQSQDQQQNSKEEQEQQNQSTNDETENQNQNQNDKQQSQDNQEQETEENQTEAEQTQSNMSDEQDDATDQNSSALDSEINQEMDQQELEKALRVLQMLQNQEQESLKNNQKIQGENFDDEKYNW